MEALTVKPKFVCFANRSQYFRVQNRNTKSDMKDQESEDVQIRRACRYVGSFAVEAAKAEERQIMVNERLEELKKTKKGAYVVMLLESYGIIVYNERETKIKFVHSINDVAFVTCSKDTKLLAIVARGPNALQAHIFRMKKKSHVKDMGVKMSRAFMNNSSKTTTITANHEQLPAEANRCWAKKEIAHGHSQSEHALRARRNTAPPELKGVQMLRSIEARNHTESRSL